MAIKYGDSTPLNVVVQLIGPEDLSEGASESAWVSMENYRSAEIHIFVGDLAGAGSAVTLDQATDNSGTGTKTLSFTKYYRTGQRISIGTVVGTFSADETITGGTSTNTATVVKVSSDELFVAFLSNGTTWTDGETITGGTSGATAVVSGTGTDEDTLAEITAAANTFTTIAVTFKHYMIPIDSSMLDVDNDFTHFQLDMGDAAASETQAVAFAIMLEPRISKYGQLSAIDAQKIT